MYLFTGLSEHNSHYNVKVIPVKFENITFQGWAKCSTCNQEILSDFEENICTMYFYCV